MKHLNILLQKKTYEKGEKSKGHRSQAEKRKGMIRKRKYGKNWRNFLPMADLGSKKEP